MPPFFAPATLFIYESTAVNATNAAVSNIADDSAARRYAYTRIRNLWV